ncbi:MAG: hypothetical protein ACI97A_003537 [Planctomycetota bacterium]|jgi:hypothetical protein
MHPIAPRLKSIIALFLWFLPTASGQSFEFQLPKSAPRGSRIVSMGFLAPRGKYHDDSTPCVQIGAKKLRGQVQVRSRWPDGSYRWLRLTFPIKMSPGISALVRVVPKSKKHAPALPKSPFSIVPKDGGFSCANSKVSFDLTADPGCVISAFRLKGRRRSILEPMIIGEGVDDASIILEEAGPYRVVFLICGQIREKGSECLIAINRRISLGRAQSEIEVETWFESSGEVIPSGGLALQFRLTDPATKFRTSVRSERLGLSDLPLKLLATTDGHVGFGHQQETFEPFAQQLQLYGKFGGVAFRVADFAEKLPSCLELTTRTTGLINLVSSSYHWYRGVKPGRRYVVGLAANQRRRRLLSFHRPTIKARGSLGRRDLSKRPDYPLAKHSAIADQIRELIRCELEPAQARRRGFSWNGEENYGDWRWNKTDAGNLEYDTASGLRAAAAYLNDPTLLDCARAAIRHLFQRDLSETGLPLIHGAYHRHGGIEAGHMWLAGATQESVLGGDPFLAESLEGMIEDWLRVAPRLLRRKLNSRSVAWSLIFAADVFYLGNEEQSRPLINGLFEKINHAPGLTIPLFDAIPKSEGLYQVAPWVAVGILGEAIWHAPPLAKKKVSTERFIKSVEAILKAAWRGPELGLAKSLIMTEVGEAPTFIGGKATGEEALFFALGLVRAAQLGGSQELLKPARAVCLWALDHLAIERGAFSGMRLSQLLWVYPRLFGPN